MAIETSCNNMMSGLKDNTVDDSNTMHCLGKSNEETTHLPTKVEDYNRAMYCLDHYFSTIKIADYDSMKKYYDMAIEQGSMMDYSSMKKHNSMMNNRKKKPKFIRQKQ